MKIRITKADDNEHASWVHVLVGAQSKESAGCDLRAAIGAPISIRPGERVLIPCGIRSAIPSGYFADIRPRSGLALKHGVTVLNAPGTIDSDYRGEWGVILINLGSRTVSVQNGDRIAQCIIRRRESFTWLAVNVDDLDDTERGSGGFGSTGVK